MLSRMIIRKRQSGFDTVNYIDTIPEIPPVPFKFCSKRDKKIQKAVVEVRIVSLRPIIYTGFEL